ncbi:MAG: response regulator transcription factor [Anaerolineae bacterium]
MFQNFLKLFKVAHLSETENDQDEPDANPGRYKLTLALDQQLLSAIKELAVEANQTTEEITCKLLDDALQERQAADAWLEVWNSLTPREKQAAGLTCLGYTNKQIAAEMIISENTVKTYIKNVLARFEVNSKVELRDLLSSWDFAEWLKGSLNS